MAKVKAMDRSGSRREFVEGDGDVILKKVRVLDFGDGIRFEPRRLMEKWAKERRVVNASSYFGLRKAKICFVVADLSANGVQLEMISVAVALKEVGYDIQVYSLKGGPVNASWRDEGFDDSPVNYMTKKRAESSIDCFGIDNEKSKRDKEIEMLKEEFGRVSKNLSLKELECVELKKDLDKKSEQIRIAFDQIEHKDAEISRLKCIDLTHHTNSKDNLAAGPSDILKSKARVGNCLASSSEFAVQENCSHIITDEIRHNRNMGVQTEFAEKVFDGNTKSNNIEYDLSNKLHAIWGIPQSQICGRNLISEISVTCSADLRVLFKISGALRNASNKPNYGDAQSPQSADNAKLSHLHDVLAKVHSEMASFRLLLEALFDLCTLENVEVVHVSLRILNATLKYLSCQTRSNRSYSAQEKCFG